MARKVFVHAAELVLQQGVDPADTGAAVTVELCGHWKHEGPCRWPHNNDIDSSVTPARFRTVFVCEPAEEQEIRGRIEDALRGAAGWRIVSVGRRSLTLEEQALGERLARTPMPRSDTLVFVPAWNEEENLPAVLDELRRGLPQADVLVVDDGSTDRTAEVARGHGAKVISFGTNRGLPAGIAAGYGYAEEQGYAFCGRVDADGQHPVEELARLLERVKSDVCDVAVGSRFASGDGYTAYRYEPSGPRRFGTALLRRSMKVALRRPFLDATSGMYAANANALPILARPYTSEAPEVQALLRLEEEGLRVDEVPVDMRARASGESKLRGKKAVMVVLTIAGTLLALERWRR